MEIERVERCSLVTCDRPSAFKLKWNDGSCIYLCRDHFSELRAAFEEYI